MATVIKFVLLSASVISIQTKTFNKDLNPTLTKNAVLENVMEDMPGKEMPNAQEPKATSNHSRESKIRIIQVPKRYFERSTFIVEVDCSNESVFAAEIVVSTDSQEKAVAFRKVFRCASESSNTFNIHLKLPRYLAYKPGHFNKYSVYVDSTMLRCWLLEKKTYDSIDENDTLGYYDYSGLRFESSINLAEPYDRPTRPALKSYDWLNEQLSKLPYSPKCDSEFEVAKAVSFPVALSGLSAGIHRVYGPYNNVYLRANHFQALRKPVFSFAMWLYIEEYCYQKYCSILQHITWDDRFATPQISLNDEGQVGVELIMEKGKGAFHLSSADQIIPKYTWSLLILACQPKQCNLSVSLGHPFKLLWMKTMSVKDNETMYFDDTVGMMIYGGSELSNSFKGYIGKVTFYRRRAIMPQEAEKLSNEDTAMKLQLNSRHSKCLRYVKHIHQLMDRQKCIIMKALRKVTCPAKNRNPFYNANDYSTTLDSDNCLSSPSQKFSLYSYVYELVREYSYRGWFSEFKMIADEIYSHAEYLLDERGADDMELITSLLKQSSCLGNHDASFMLSVILNYGVAVKSVEVEPHSFLMYGALEGNRLCLLSLGNKHIYSLDGFTHDYEQAYVYFKLVAEMTNRDLRVHNMDDIYTEMVRLTNDVEVREQTQEDGDIIQFLKMRADQGVLLAQKRLARMYYWGSGGLSRNIKMAFKYYKMAADSGDPSSLYDYGIILLKGHGTEKNVPLAVELLKKAADQGFAQALNSLGWYAMEIEKNNSKAAEYFHQSHDLGNKDASFNLAHMLLRGKYPNSTIDKVRAWEYIAAGALRGQYEAGILVGKYNMRGHPKIRRNPELAVGWMRFVAERNPGIGKLLHKGLKYYKDSNWFSALVYYLMSASTGVEVANFNLAYLCDEDNGGFVKLLDKECKWRHYNLSTQRAAKDVDPYAWNKMAHYHYYHGSNGQQDKQEAVRLYFNAAIRGDPQGLYNLAMLINEGVNVSEYHLNSLLVPAEFQTDKFYLAGHLLMRCQDLQNSEAYLPCTFALYELVFKRVWTHFGTYIILLGLMMMSSVAFCSGLHR